MAILKTSTNIALHIRNKIDAKNIAIYEQDKKNEVLTNAQFIDTASVVDDKKLMEHPKEDGTMIVDHVVNNPSEVEVSLLLADDDSSTLNEIWDYYENSTPLTIKVKNEIYTNLVMSSKPVRVDDQHYDKTVYNLSFKEIQNAISQYVKMSVPEVKQKQNASKVNTGQKQPQQPQQKSVSTMAQIKKKAGL